MRLCYLLGRSVKAVGVLRETIDDRRIRIDIVYKVAISANDDLWSIVAFIRIRAGYCIAGVSMDLKTDA